ncbi:nucleoplasmin-like isoform X2 [Poecile atricapillus]|uniref:nucleoplasmin-like isoform X2 n=1 Tax=Poecile atricapillus TaxID=48891 RepID=UPI00273A3248|nr:nucleoplasmin-like isoform X2 [Poecile atricapillus]
MGGGFSSHRRALPRSTFGHKSVSVCSVPGQFLSWFVSPLPCEINLWISAVPPNVSGSEGCRLATGARSCVVEEDDDFLEHLVLLRTICLGAEARDELHVVAVDSKNASGEHRPVPIAALRSSLLPMVRAARSQPLPRGDTWGRGSRSCGSLQINLKGLELVPPVTFVLQCGAGPVYLSGQRVTLEDGAVSEARDEELSEEDGGDEGDDGAS